MEEVVVSDTNILIDLLSVELTDAFFSLPICIHSTDFVISELKEEEQYRKIKSYITSKQLKIKSYTEAEILDLFAFRDTCSNNVSIADCSVLWYSKENKYILLTGDRKLKSVARSYEVVVYGILYIFDLMVEKFKIIPKNIGAERLEKLSNINHRLPKDEIENRINKWGK